MDPSSIDHKTHLKVETPPEVASSSPTQTKALPAPHTPAQELRPITFKARVLSTPEDVANFISSIKSRVLEFINRLFGETPLPETTAHKDIAFTIVNNKNFAKRFGKVFGFFIKDIDKKNQILQELTEQYPKLNDSQKKNIKHFLNGLLKNEEPLLLVILEPKIEKLNTLLKQDHLPHFSNAELIETGITFVNGTHDLEGELKNLEDSNFDHHALANAVAHDLNQETLAIVKNIRSRELQNTTMIKKNERLSPNIINAYQRSEKLKNAVIEHILTSPNKKKVIEFYLTVAENLRKRGDFEALLAVAGAFQSQPILRMIGPGKIQLDKEYQSINERLLALLDPANGNEALNKAVKNTKGAVIPPVILLVKSATMASEMFGNIKKEVSGNKLHALSERFETVNSYQNLPDPEELSFNLNPLYHSRIKDEGIFYTLSQQAVGGEKKLLLDLSDLVSVLNEAKGLKLRIQSDGLVAVERSLVSIESREGQSDEADQAVNFVLDRVINSLNADPSSERLVQAKNVLELLKKNEWVKSVLDKHPETSEKLLKANLAFEKAISKENAKSTYGIPEMILKINSDSKVAERIGLAFEFLYPRKEDQEEMLKGILNGPNADVFLRAVQKNASRELLERGVLPISYTIKERVYLIPDNIIPENRKEQIETMAHDLKAYANSLLNAIRAADILNTNKEALASLAAYDQNIQNWVRNNILMAENPEDLKNQFEFYVDLALEMKKNHDFISAYSLVTALSNLERLFGEGKYPLSSDTLDKLAALKEDMKDSKLNQAYEKAREDQKPLPPILIMIRNLTATSENKSNKGLVNENNLLVAGKFVSILEKIPTQTETIISYNVEALLKGAPNTETLDRLEERWLPRGLNYSLRGLVKLVRQASQGKKFTIETREVNGTKKDFARVVPRRDLPGVAIGTSDDAKRGLEQILNHAVAYIKVPQIGTDSAIQEIADYLRDDPWAQAVLKHHPELQDKVNIIRDFAFKNKPEVDRSESKKTEQATQAIELLRTAIPKLGPNQKPVIRKLPSGEYDLTIINRSESIFDFSFITERRVASSEEAIATLNNIHEMMEQIDKDKNNPYRAEASQILQNLMETPWMKSVITRFPDHPLVQINRQLAQNYVRG